MPDRILLLQSRHPSAFGRSACACSCYQSWFVSVGRVCGSLSQSSPAAGCPSIWCGWLPPCRFPCCEVPAAPTDLESSGRVPFVSLPSSHSSCSFASWNRRTIVAFLLLTDGTWLCSCLTILVLTIINSWKTMSLKASIRGQQLAQRSQKHPAASCLNPRHFCLLQWSAWERLPLSPSLGTKSVWKSICLPQSDHPPRSSQPLPPKQTQPKYQPSPHLSAGKQRV